MNDLDDSWTTIEGESSASLKVQRSEFVAVAFPCESEEEFQQRLVELQKEHFDATHHCWAWRLYSEGEIRGRSSDAGEPSGSAGRPILGAIESAGLLDVAVVVIRYYGGVKLGTGGLARAYRDAARAAIEKSQRRERFLYDAITVLVPFERLSAAYRLIEPPHVLLDAEEYGESNRFTFSVRRSRRRAFEEELVAQRLGLA